MRDLVETVIAQVMKQDPRPAPEKHRAPAHATDLHKFTGMMDAATRNAKPVQTRQVQAHPDQRLWHASRQFEAMMFQQMMSAMRKTIPSSGVLKTGFAEDVQGAMFDQAVSKSASQQGSLGIANSIYRQLSRPGTVQNSESRASITQANANPSDKPIQETITLEKAPI